jgi:ribosomal-protein-alanine N-acetyltransferase
MIKKLVIHTNRLILKTFTQEDVTESYKDWLHDEKINQYLDVRHRLPICMNSLKMFAISCEQDERIEFLGIYIRKGKILIGTMKIGPINFLNANSEIGFMVGDKNYHGLGYATEAIKKVVDYMVKVRRLNKIYANCNSKNIASKKTLLKCGFIQQQEWKVESNKKICNIRFEYDSNIT